MVEEWRPIPGYDGYEASNLGRVRSVDRWVEQRRRDGFHRRRFLRGKVLAQRSQGGYRYVPELDYAHRLVMLAFEGPPPDGMEVAHGDGVRSHNRLGNLTYKTPSSNQMDRVGHGTSNRGERSAFAKLTEHDVLMIRQVSDETQVALAKRFGVSRQHIKNIIDRKKWGWL